MCYQEMQDEVPDRVPTKKDMLVAELMTVLNWQARNLGYACGVNLEGYRRIRRMTKSSYRTRSIELSA